MKKHLVITFALVVTVITLGQAAYQNPLAKALSDRIDALEERVEKLETILAGMVAKLPAQQPVPAPGAQPALVRPGPAPAEWYRYEVRWDRILLRAAIDQEYKEKFKVD